MRWAVLLFFILITCSYKVFAQVPTINVNLSAAADTTVTITNVGRNGLTCGGSGPDNCVIFNITVNSKTDLISFGPSQITSASFYSINCGTPIASGTPACISGLTSFQISFCKPGSNAFDFTITALTNVKASPDITLRQGCTGTMSVTGLSAATTTWTSISPGAAGTYNNYLSSTSGTTVNVTPQVGSPLTYIDYQVTGNQNTLCSGIKRDTVRVYVTPALTVAITPSNPAICPGTSVQLTAAPTGGNPAYTYLWNTGATTQSITVNTAGTYSVSVMDNTTGCAAIVQQVIVTAATTPSPPTVSGTTICSGSTAILTATGPGGTYRWYNASSGGSLLATGASFTTPALTANTTYYVETTIICTSARTPVTVSVTPIPSAPIAPGTTICSGTTAILTATAPGGTYQWYDAASGGNLLATAGSFTTPALTGNTTYYVQTTVNGCTSARTAVTVTVTPLPALPTVSGATMCEGNIATLTATAPGGAYQWYNAASGGTLLGTGAVYTTPILTTTTTYYVQTTVNGCASGRTAVTVTVIPLIDPEFQYSSGTYCKSGTATTPAPNIYTTGGGTFSSTAGLVFVSTSTGEIDVLASVPGTYTVTFTNNSPCPRSTTANVTITNAPDATFSFGGPFCQFDNNPLPTFPFGSSAGVFSASPAGLVFISTSTGEINLDTSLPGTYTITNTIAASVGCIEALATFTMTINPTPAAPTVLAAPICSGTTATLSATAPGGAYQWYDAAIGGNLLWSGAIYTTPVLTANTTYYVQTTVTGCTSSRTAVTVTVNPIPPAPTVSGGTICAGSAMTLTVTGPGGTYQWYDAASGGNLLGTGATYTGPALTATTTYYVQTTVNGCISARTAVTITVNPIPAVPTASGTTICSGSTAVLTASSPGGTYQWYDASSGGNLLATGAAYTTAALTITTTYYVQATVNGCTSARTPVTVNITPVPAAPTASGTSICSGGTSILTAIVPGGTYQWYDASSGGNLLLTGTSFVTPVLTATTTYYVQTTVNGCTSARTAVTVNVTPVPATPSVLGITTCEGTAATLTVTAPGGFYQWYNAASGGVLLETGTTYTTSVLTSTTTYYVQTTVNGCTSARTAVTVNIIPITDPEFQYSSGTYCKSGSPTAPPPAIFTVGGGTFSAPAGLVFVSTSTGEIDVLASAVGTYTVTFTNNSPCPRSTTANVTITNAPDARFSFGGPFCQFDNNPQPSFPAGSSAGIFSSASSGLVFFNTSTGEINLDASLPGTYTVTNTIAASGGCIATSATFTVTINATPALPSVGSQTICSGTKAILTATAPGGTYRWYDAASGGNLLETGATYTTPVLNASIIYYVQTTVNDCTSGRTAVTVTVNPIPTAPTALGATICSGSSGALIASSPGGSYQWYDASSGGNLLGTGSAYATPILVVSTTYYVQTTINGCTSPRTAVTVTVNPIPPAPTVSGTTICSGSIAILTATAPGGNYQWYNAASGGNLLGAGVAYTTPVLTTSMIYYIQTTVDGCTSTRTPVAVSINPIPVAPTATATIICSGTSTILTASGSSGAYQWYNVAFGGNLLGTGVAYTTSVLTSTTTYYVQTTVNGCTSARTAVTVNIIPITDPEFQYSSGTYCKSGSPTAPPPAIFTVGGGTFSAPAGLVFVSTSTGEIDVLASAVGTYTVTFTNNSPCPRSSTANVTITNAPDARFFFVGPFCQFDNNPLPSFPAGSSAGIFSSASSGLVFFNTSTGEINLDASLAGTYTITNTIAATGTCAAASSISTITINPLPVSPIVPTPTICSGNTATFSAIAPGEIYQWYDAPSGGKLLGTGPVYTSPVLTTSTIYYVQTIINGCTSLRTAVTAIVIPVPATPAATSNSPVCRGNPIFLSTALVVGASYLWTGPDGFSSTLQNPVINGAASINAGVYSVMITLNGCISFPGSVNIVVNELPLANAGPDQTVCITTNVISLRGTIGGGSATGVWTSNGSGTFLPSNTSLNATYIPSNADKSVSGLTLTLTLVNNGGCTPTVSASSMNILFRSLPVVSAGPDQAVCTDNATISLTGLVSGATSWIWSSSGTGKFIPSNTSLNAVYIASAADILRKSVVLTLTSMGNGLCSPVNDNIKMSINPLPIANTGPDIFILEKTTAILESKVNEPNVSYEWTPNISLSNNKIKNPVFSGLEDQIYILRITNQWGCTAEDTLSVKVLKPIQIPNTFTPNGDGINDVWNIAQLENYPAATVQVFNRYGVRIYNSVTYEQPWDGTFKERPMPEGTYYYIIDTKFPGQLFSGSITILR